MYFYFDSMLVALLRIITFMPLFISITIIFTIISITVIIIKYIIDQFSLL